MRGRRDWLGVVLILLVLASAVALALYDRHRGTKSMPPKPPNPWYGTSGDD